jgi:hypothetical protein
MDTTQAEVWVLRMPIKSESTALVLGHHMKRHRMSYETASNVSDVANWALVISLVVGVAATFAM